MGIMSPRNEIVEGDNPTAYGSFGLRVSSAEIVRDVTKEFNRAIDDVKLDKEKGCFINKDYQFYQIPEKDDPVNHPAHYKAYSGFEVIDLTEQMNFNRGNAVKYIARAGLKSKETEVQDLQKAAWYIKREIERLQRNDDE